jgi:vacuolar protein sorting-associated protein 33A
MLVYYVGGVTYMEIAALRCLAASKDFPYEIIIATTRIISGSSFLEALLPAFDNGLTVAATARS